MGDAGDQIFVRSHTARDLLQSAALFKTDKLVVWEYVSNGLEYVDPGTSPFVRVRLDSRNKRIVVSDNGRGMNWADLQNFFIMHGENVDRKRGRPGRGRFGTGKSAVFGIADVLRITSVRQGRRSKVELARTNIEAMKAEDPIPVRILEREAPTDSSSGTEIQIEGVHLRTLDQPGVIQFVERHLARWPRDTTVFVNNHECEFTEPVVAEERRFAPHGALRKTLGDVELSVKVSKSPLDEEFRGIVIFSKGVWYETTLAGSEGRDMSQYLFGEIDVPRLDEDTSPIPPFDMSRTMRLNPSNDLVQAIYGFIGPKVEGVRRELMEAERKRKASEEARKLEEHAKQIAQVINEDFHAFRQRIAKAKAKVTGDTDIHDIGPGGDGSEDDLLFGSELPAEILGHEPRTSDVSVHEEESPPREYEPIVAPAESDEPKGRPAGVSNDKGKSPRGGFQVRFDYMGIESHRAHYVRDERTIYVNLDHPQLVAGRGKAELDDLTFRRLAYEVAFSEYAVALASELAARDEFLDPSDPIVEIRETLNRVARRAASLYSE
jgi:hypothetical protein